MPATGSPRLVGIRNPFPLPALSPNIAELVAYDLSLMATAGDGSAGSPWSGWETALNALPANVTIKAPSRTDGAGSYSQTALVTMKGGWRLVGDGVFATLFNSTFAGSAFRTAFAPNSSTGAHISIEDLSIINTNGANNGSAFVECGGTFVYLTRVKTSGFKFGVALNQSEIVTLSECEFDSATIGVWLVNGADYTTAGGRCDLDLTAYSTQYRTNAITIRDCQFNANTWDIADDGGVAHRFIDNNYNAGTSAIRLAGTTAARIVGSDFEASTSTCIVSSNIKFFAGGVTSNTALTIGPANRFLPAVGQSAINFAAGAADVTFIANNYSTSVTAVTGCASLSSATVLGVETQAGAGALYNDRTKFTFDTTVVQRHVRAYAAGAQSLNDSTLTPVNFDTESYDVGGFHDNVTNNTRFTVPAADVGAGLYRITAQVAFAANATGVRMLQIRKNGATSLAFTRVPSAGGALSTIIQVSVEDTPLANDYYEILAFQTSGGALSTAGGSDSTWGSVVRLH